MVAIATGFFIYPIMCAPCHLLTSEKWRTTHLVEKTGFLQDLAYAIYELSDVLHVVVEVG